MPAFINRFPQGLLGLLDLKTQGVNPSLLGEIVTPVLELSNFYALNSRASNSQSSTLTGLGVTAGAYANLVVPQGELWVLYNLTAHLAAAPLGAAATFSCGVGYVPTDNNRFIGLGAESQQIITGDDVIAQWQGEFVLAPGDSPQVYVTRLTGGNLGVRLNLVRARIPV